MPQAEDALALVDESFSAFPLRGKHPLTAHGSHDATRDKDQIFAWWKQWPNANIGIATGLKWGLGILDIDGADGMITLRQHLKEHGQLPETRIGRTSRGFHIYFAIVEEMPNSAGTRLGEGLDFRGKGGYVVAPPSIHPSGEIYTWYREAELAPLPKWIAKGLKPIAPLRVSLEPPEIGFAGSMTPYGRAVYEGLVADIHQAPHGTRNDVLHRSVFRLARFAAAGHFTRADIEAGVTAAAQAQGASEKYVQQVFDSSWDAGLMFPHEVRAESNDSEISAPRISAPQVQP